MTIPFINQAKEEYDRTKGEIDNLEVDIQDMTVKLEVLRSRVPLLEQLIYRYEHEDETPAAEAKPKTTRRRRRATGQVADAGFPAEPVEPVVEPESGANDQPGEPPVTTHESEDGTVTFEVNDSDNVSASTTDSVPANENGNGNTHVQDWRSHVSHKARRLDAKVREVERSMRDGDEMAPEWIGRRGLLTEVELALQNPANGNACFERLVEKLDRELEQINSPVTSLFAD